jgi:ADP-heptose:LPS heptosyltransferase
LNQDIPKSILIIQLAGLGDMVMATPAIEALKQLYPKAKICLLTNPRSIEIIRGNPYVDEVYVLIGARDIFTTIKKLRSNHFDMVVNLYRLYSLKGAIKMFLLFWLIRGKYWVGRDTDGRGFFYHLKVPEKLSDKRHEVEYKLDIVRALGGQISDTNLRAEHDRNDENFVNDILNKIGISQRDILVGINCSAFRSAYNWMIDGYAKLGDYLIERFKVKVIFLGVNKDRSKFVKIKALMRQKPLDFVGTFSVRQLAYFLKRCNLLVSPDCGTVHIASALAVPMVVLFGPGEYARYKPYGNEEKTVIIRKDVPCVPCFKNSCFDNRCMKLITPEEVFEASEQLLKKTNAQV